MHEALTFEQKKEDYFHNCGGMPLSILIVGLVSHLLLTCNSAFNFFLYCCMSDQFRGELRKILGIPETASGSQIILQQNEANAAGEAQPLPDVTIPSSNIENGVRLVVTQTQNEGAPTTRTVNNVLTTSL